MAGEHPDPAEVYKAVRAHELMLNEAAAAQERSIVPPLLTLNGGAAVAFLTLLGALGKDTASLKVDLEWAMGAIGTWMAGLLLAAAAGSAAASRQKQINKGFRLMREQIEFEVFDHELAQIVVPPSPEPSLQARLLGPLVGRLKRMWGDIGKAVRKGADDTVEDEDDRKAGRVKASGAARRRHTAYNFFWTTSALAFVAGGFLALNAVSVAADAVDPNLPLSTPSQRLAPMTPRAVTLAAKPLERSDVPLRGGMGPVGLAPLRGDVTVRIANAA